MDRGLRQGMRHMPTKQNPHPSKENAPLRNHHPHQCATIPTSGHGPNHGTAPKERKGRHTNHRRSRMLTCSNLHPMFHNNHGTQNRTALLTQRLQVVRITHENHIGPGPEIHFPLRQSPNGQTWDFPEPLYGVSPSNRRDIRKEESMDRTIPPNSDVRKP